MSGLGALAKRGQRYMKLLSVLQRLAAKAMRDPEIRELAKRYSRSMQLITYDELGDFLAAWIGIENGEPVIRQGTYPATTTVKMHIDVLLDILEGKLDFRTAVAHGVVEVYSGDGLPWFYHFALWASFFDKIKRLLGR